MNQETEFRAEDGIVIDWDGLQYVSTVPQSLFCPVCKNVLVTPLQTSCEFAHTLCARCITRALDDRLECPVDRTQMPKGLQECNLPPRILSLVLEELEVYCPNAGCTRIVTRGSLEVHLKEQCDWQLVKCMDDSCVSLVYRKECDGECCTHITTECEHCHQAIMQRDAIAHLDECTELSQLCPHCAEDFSADGLRQHRLMCHSSPVSCPAKDFGCNWHGTLQHISAHLDICSINMMKPHLQAQEHKLADLTLQNLVLTQKLESIAVSREQESVIEISSEYERDRTYLFETLKTLSSSLENLSTSLASLDTRQNHIIMNESMRTKDEIAMIRGGLQALRLQWHHFVQNTRGPLATFRPAEEQETGHLDHNNLNRVSQSRSSSNDSTRVKL